MQHHSCLGLPLLNWLLSQWWTPHITAFVLICILLSITSSRLAHFVANAVGCVYHIFSLSHPSVVSVPALGNITALNLGCGNLFEILISIPLEIAPEVGFLVHASSISCSGGTSTLLPTPAERQPAACSSPLLHILGNTYLLFIDNHLILCGEMLVLWFWSAFPSWLVIWASFQRSLQIE